jgi:hypothetical protein
LTDLQKAGTITVRHFHKCGYPKMDGLQWKILLKWMIWRYPHFRKPSYADLWILCS